ncbi:unnamed protein product [Rangifer tarandus platyrhynchus]|uniref:Uncharacterized protein n=1 Tax=Rangifer tarandus platyrhynchus TaxID=3082113 RepID=A0ABN8YJL3_RANTA|nr:unnamed protein product [Rangifer tarandus platyrhynchus]
MTLFRVMFSTRYQAQSRRFLSTEAGGALRAATCIYSGSPASPPRRCGACTHLTEGHAESSWQQGAQGCPGVGPPGTPHSEGTAGLPSPIRTGSPEERNRRDTGKNTQGAHGGRSGKHTENRPPLLNQGRTRPSDRSPELVTGGGSSSKGQAAEREGREGHQDTRMLERSGGQPPVRDRIRGRAGLHCEEAVCSWFFTAGLTRSSRLGPHRGRCSKRCSSCTLAYVRPQRHTMEAFYTLIRNDPQTHEGMSAVAASAGLVRVRGQAGLLVGVEVSELSWLCEGPDFSSQPKDYHLEQSQHHLSLRLSQESGPECQTEHAASGQSPPAGSCPSLPACSRSPDPRTPLLPAELLSLPPAPASSRMLAPEPETRLALPLSCPKHLLKLQAWAQCHLPRATSPGPRVGTTASETSRLGPATASQLLELQLRWSLTDAWQPRLRHRTGLWRTRTQSSRNAQEALLPHGPEDEVHTWAHSPAGQLPSPLPGAPGFGSCRGPTTLFVKLHLCKANCSAWGSALPLTGRPRALPTRHGTWQQADAPGDLSGEDAPRRRSVGLALLKTLYSDCVHKEGTLLRDGSHEHVIKPRGP